MGASDMAAATPSKYYGVPPVQLRGRVPSVPCRRHPATRPAGRP
eukprot:CAMPEP_0183395696 /NCGR_PEP_ID=MMETSP0370-20130417/9507_1 /TAXON_ID=268820 /ORGANISM="Peridinium aciculiferum, Strain PAER-2" /LENGTH=43 /DNA_ID= /DNA_START= /DNA_END= /DNA_ORIENTATION=